MFKAPSIPAPVLPQQPQAPQMTAPNQKPQAKASQPTFIGAAAAANPSNTGNKTLLGGGTG